VRVQTATPVAPDRGPRPVHDRHPPTGAIRRAR
jgi:hypothetical protein